MQEVLGIIRIEQFVTFLSNGSSELNLISLLVKPDDGT